jgi:hypothetical protein
MAVQSDQFAMRAFFNDLAIAYHGDRIGVAYGRQPVGDDDGGAAFA